MNLVGLVSSYREGNLLAGAVRSLANSVDAMLVYEGPAGEPLENEAACPHTNYIGAHHGRWRTDARKRNEMLQDAKKRWPGVGWGIWLDGDEILVNAQYLRDLLQAVLWNDEQDDTETPTIRYPIRKIEADGSMSMTGSRVFRLDLVRSIDISVSVVTNQYGIEEAWGDVPSSSAAFVHHYMRALDHGRMIAWPPMPCEPHIFHRSHLRHPARRGLRLHKQEAVELKKAGKL